MHSFKKLVSIFAFFAWLFQPALGSGSVEIIEGSSPEALSIKSQVLNLSLSQNIRTLLEFGLQEATLELEGTPAKLKYGVKVPPKTPILSWWCTEFLVYLFNQSGVVTFSGKKLEDWAKIGNNKHFRNFFRTYGKGYTGQSIVDEIEAGDFLQLKMNKTTEELLEQEAQNLPFSSWWSAPRRHLLQWLGPRIKSESLLGHSSLVLFVDPLRKFIITLDGNSDADNRVRLHRRPLTESDGSLLPEFLFLGKTQSIL